MRFGKNEILNLLGNKMIFCRTNLGLIVLLIWCLMIGMVFPKGSVKADSVYIDLERMDGESAGTPVGEIWAVDSWFLTLVTEKNTKQNLMLTYRLQNLKMEMSRYKKILTCLNDHRNDQPKSCRQKSLRNTTCNDSR